MSKSAVQRFQDWYQQHCDGEWERSEEIKIFTLGNPGWRLSVGIADTEVAGIQTDWVRLERSDDDWVFYRSTGAVFEVACGPLNLEEAIEQFLVFVGA